MTAVPELKPETPTVCITCHEDYRYALQRIGQIEDAKPHSVEASRTGCPSGQLSSSMRRASYRPPGHRG